MPVKSQDELEKPAKVYQVDAVEAKVDQALALLTQLNQKAEGLVTSSQLETLKTDIKEYVDDEIAKVHLAYKPGKDRSELLFKIVVTQAVAIVGSIIIAYFVVKG